MKFDNLYNSLLKEGEYGGWEPEDEKEKPEDTTDPLEDPMFQQALEILDELRLRDPDRFEKFVQRLNDIIEYKKGVSL